MGTHASNPIEGHRYNAAQRDLLLKVLADHPLRFTRTDPGVYRAHGQAGSYRIGRNDNEPAGSCNLWVLERGDGSELRAYPTLRAAIAGAVKNHTNRALFALDQLLADDAGPFSGAGPHAHLAATLRRLGA